MLLPLGSIKSDNYRIAIVERLITLKKSNKGKKKRSDIKNNAKITIHTRCNREKFDNNDG